MKLIRYEKPTIENWFSDSDRFFGLRDWPSLLDWNLPSTNDRRLSADLFEDDDAFYARFELPGVKKKDVTIELHKAVLTVSYEKQWKGENGTNTETYSRALPVPDGISEKKISAKHDDGLLTITMPKVEAAKPRTIKVG